MDRRSFLKNTLAGAGVAAGLKALGMPGFAEEKAPEKTPDKPKAVLKLCSQDGKIPGKNVKEKAEKILKYGGCGLEFGGLDVKRAEQIKKDLEGTGVGPAALCWGSAGGALVSMDMEKRKKGIQDLKNQLDAAGALGSPGVIFVPCFHRQSDLKPEELDKVLLEILPELGDHAKKAGSRVLLEPLNKGETFYINLVSHAARICKQVNNPGICLMGDFYHMGKGVKDGLAKSDQEEFVAGGTYLHHVHVATVKGRTLPSFEDHSFVDGFIGLKKIGYQDYCSLECSIPKSTTAEEGIPKAFAFLKQQWEEAKI